MLVPLRSDTPLEGRYDLCLVGSGPAGGTLADEVVRQLENWPSGQPRPRIVLLESGAKRVSPAANQLRAVESSGLFIKEYSRERLLGGTSSTWAGLSSPLDPADLAPRAGLAPGSHWPLDLEALWPYYARASERHGFAALERFTPGGLERLRQKGQFQPQWQLLEEKIFLAADPPQRFGERLQDLFQGPHLTVLLEAHVVRVQSAADEHGNLRVSGVELALRDGSWRSLSCQRVVLCCGGIENARLLLNSPTALGQALGNQHDQVGRYFMNHPKNYFGVLRLKRPVSSAPYFFGFLENGFAGYGGLKLSSAEQRKRQLLNSYVRFEPLFPWSDNQGVESLVALAKRASFLLNRWKRAQGGRLVELRDYAETGDDSDLQNAGQGASQVLRWFGLVLRHLPSVLQYAWFRAISRRAPRIQRVRLRNFMEMEPDPENRVLLASGLDAYGQRLPRVQAQVTDLDRRSMVAVQTQLAQELEQQGLGQLERPLGAEHLDPQQPWPIDQDASHHLGTTRMGHDPRTSVVDAQLEVHGVRGLYVAGGSVFPTSGCANPTYTIVALSLRLGDHLVAVLQGQANTAGASQASRY
jgi:choline dehydrogenase-like flavoprotein